jgi:hypothetical protein
MGVHSTSDGRVSTVLEHPAEKRYQEALHSDASTRVALSADGRWLAIAGKTSFVLYAVPSGKPVMHEQREDHWPGSVHFDDTSTRLALARRAPDQPRYREVVVFEYANQRWQEAARFGGASEPAWTTSGLVFLREGSIDRWHEGASQVRLRFAEGWVPMQFADDRGTSIHCSPNGNAAVVEAPGRFMVADLERGKSLYKRSMRRGKASVQTAAVSAKRASVFFGDQLEGVLVQVDLQSGRVSPEKSWGRLGEYSDGLFNFSERPAWKPAYWPQLSSTGRYLVIREPDGMNLLHRLDATRP